MGFFCFVKNSKQVPPIQLANDLQQHFVVHTETSYDKYNSKELIYFIFSQILEFCGESLFCNILI